MLQGQEKQYTGVDMRHVVIDDVTSRALTDFSNIVDLLQLRVARQTEDLALCAIDSRGREGKGITWKKLDLKIAAVAVYLRNKIKLREGDHVILMYTHSEDYVYAVYACFCMGIIAVPLAILDTNRLHEDVPAFLHIVSDFRVKAVLVNNEVDAMLKSKIVSTHIKHTATAMKVSIPHQYNTARPSKQSNGCRELGFTMHPQWVQPSRPALIWTYWTPDQRRQSVQLSHSTIMGICKVQKETCQMISGKSILGCVRGSNGLGFVYTCLLGIFLGASTYLVSPVDFAQNPISLFLALNRYKIKDTYSTGQMLEHAMNSIKASDIKLPDLHNLMIAADGRPKTDIFSRVRLHFANSGLDSTAINTIYSHVLNPFIASRSYMSIKPMELWLDTRALRRGLVIPVDPEQDPSALLVQDSGMAPISTSIAIVNPNTCQLCQVGEYGEIWVQSEANVSCIYKSNDPLDAERFNGIINGGDPMARYMRTGDFGFLHYTSRRVGPRGSQVELQCLFVLGSIGETFEVNGLLHFPIDIETSVEKSHRNIVPGGCIVFQAGGTIVVVAEVSRRSYLASMVPVVVNAVLNEHQLIVDKVAFVAQGDFARSRLNEKQRGRIMATWVLRKLNTIAQFSIRDTIDDDEEQRQFLIKHETSMKSSGTHSLRVAATMNAAVSTANDEQNPYLSNGRPRDSLNSRSSSVGMDGFPVSVLTAAELSPPAGLDDRMMDPNPMDEFRFDSQTGFTSDSSTTARAASRQSASSHHKTDSSGARTIHELSSTYESRGGEVTGTSPAFPLRRISLSDRSMHERDSPHIPHPQHFYGAPMEPEPAAPPRPPKIEPTLEIPYRTKPIMSPPQLLQPSMGQPSSKLRVVNDEQLIDLDISVEEAIRRASRPTSQSIDGQMPAGHYPNRLSSFGYPMDTIGRGGGGAGGVGGGVRGDLGGLPSQRPRYDGSEWDR